MIAQGNSADTFSMIVWTRRFNKLAWSVPCEGRAEGVIAAGMENGEVGLWDPTKILLGQTEE